jgi:hypothetical protein
MNNVCTKDNAYLNTDDVRVTSTADVPCGSYACQHNFQLFVVKKCVLFQTFLVLLASPDNSSAVLMQFRVKQNRRPYNLLNETNLVHNILSIFRQIYL